MVPSDSSRTHAGRPPVTSRAQILTAARELIDREGWERLTIRRLALQLGIGATTLYHHVRDKQELLLLLLDEYVSSIPRPDLPHDPLERIIVAATVLRDAGAAWPWAAEAFTSDGFVGMLSHSAVWTVETIVTGAIDYGCTPAQAANVFRSIWYYTAGEILVRAHSARQRADAGQPPRPGGFFGNLDASQAPGLAAVGDRWPEISARDTYAHGLRVFVGALLERPSPEDF